MKPAAVVLVLSLGILSGGPPALAEGPWQFAEPLLGASPFTEVEQPGHWQAPWPTRPAVVADGAELWSDYRGACIEHDLYRPRFLAPPGGEHQRRPLLSAIGNLLDGLFAWMPLHRHDEHSHDDPSTAFQAHDIETPAFSPPEDSPRRRPAPLLTPVPVPESNPPPSIQPAPQRPTPVQVVPVDPAPTPPAFQPPPNEIPKRSPPSGPIIELVPEPVLPADVAPPATAVPRNRVPRDRQPLPRNAVPR